MATSRVLLTVLLILLTIYITTATKHPATISSTNWAKTVITNKEKTTTLQFYFHDTISGKNPTAVLLIPPSNVTKGSNTGFGTVIMVDDKLTVGPKPNSKEVGRAQGMYGSAGINEMGIIMSISYYFTDGVYNGSSIVMLGRNTASFQVHEMPVVGGTGVFQMARGYALVHTIWSDTKTHDAIAGYNVTIIH